MERSPGGSSPVCVTNISPKIRPSRSRTERGRDVAQIFNPLVSVGIASSREEFARAEKQAARTPNASRASVLTCFTLLLLFLLSAFSVRAQTVSKEYQLRAVFLFRFTQFVDWPTNVFATPQSPMVIGVLGDNPFGDALRLAVKGETAHGRPIQIKHCRDLEESKTCHVLYISDSEAPRLKHIIGVLANRSILTVSDIEGFARDHGGMIRFITEQNKITFRINVDAAKAAGLVLDARLLRMAEVATR